MQIRKDTIYYINHETIDQFIKDVLSSGLKVRDDILSKTNYFGRLIYVDKRYVPMSFKQKDDYVYFSSDYSYRTLKQTIEKIDIDNANRDKISGLYRYTIGKKSRIIFSKTYAFVGRLLCKLEKILFIMSITKL